MGIERPSATRSIYEVGTLRGITAKRELSGSQPRADDARRPKPRRDDCDPRYCRALRTFPVRAIALEPLLKSEGEVDGYR